MNCLSHQNVLTKTQAPTHKQIYAFKDNIKKPLYKFNFKTTYL